MSSGRDLSGEELGGYLLERRLGAGASATVYQARDGDDRLVALKLLDPGADLGERKTAEGARGRLRREAGALLRLDMPGVAHVLDLEVEGPDAFLVTQYIPGPTLEEDIRASGPWPREDVAELGGLLADTLTAVHARGVCHRDIKPSNVIIGPSGPVLIDFGIANASGEQGLTQTGLVVGTPGFISPEVIGGKPAESTDDWWSLAATLLFVLTGQPPFGKGSPAAQISRVLAGKPDISRIDENLGRVFQAVLAPVEFGRTDFSRLLEALKGVSGERIDLEPTVAEDYTDWYTPTSVLPVSEGDAPLGNVTQDLEEDDPEPAPRGLPVFGLFMGVIWAICAPFEEVFFGLLAVMVMWFAATFGWHARAKRKILSLPAVVVKGLLSNLPATLLLAASLILCHAISSGNLSLDAAFFSQPIEFLSQKLAPSRLLESGLCLLSISVAWWLPISAATRFGARGFVRMVLPSWWSRALFGILLGAATFAAVWLF